MEGKRTALIRSIEMIKAQIEKTNNEDEIEKLESLVSIEKNSLKGIDNVFSENREKLVSLTEIAFKKLKIFHNDSEQFNLVKSNKIRKPTIFSEKRRIYNDAEAEYNEVINKLAPLIPTTKDWYVLEEIGKQVKKINEYEVEIEPF